MSRLSLVDGLLIESVLSTTIDQLAIVGGTLPPVSLGDNSDFPHPNVSTSPLDDIILRKNKALLSGGPRGGRELHSLALKRLSSETTYVRKVLEAALGELGEAGSAEALARSVQSSSRRKEEKEQISKKERTVREEIATLKAAIEEAKISSETEANEDNLMLAQLKDSLQEARRSTKGEETFVRQLQDVRERERAKRMEEEEHNIAVWRDDLKREIEHEQRVTLEIESWLNDRRAALKALQRHWKEKLSTDLAAMDRSLTELTTAREADATRRTERLRRLEDSQQFVKREMERREAERRRRERVELEVRTAIRIQSWWRMMMVRKGLGPYRRKKQKTSKQEAEGGRQQSKASTATRMR